MRSLLLDSLPRSHFLAARLPAIHHLFCLRKESCAATKANVQLMKGTQCVGGGFGLGQNKDGHHHSTALILAQDGSGATSKASNGSEAAAGSSSGAPIT